MGRALADQHPAAREVFDAADRALGFSLSSICWDGPDARLRETRHAQPALLTHSVAALRLSKRPASSRRGAQGTASVSTRRASPPARSRSRMPCGSCTVVAS
jgi:malonyl CoA-acyl carrier protein transacylase